MKRNFVINCETCDARGIKEENYTNYEQITLNAETLFVDEKSKEVLSRLPIMTNIESVVEIPEDVKLNIVEGDCEIRKDSKIMENTFLYVNGALSVQENTEEQLQSFWKIYVNGDLKIPERMAAFIQEIHVGGKVRKIPDGCKELDDTFVIDKYFPMRVKENSRYYVEDRVKIIDENVNVQMLADKNVEFVTKSIVAPEKLLPIIFKLVDELVKIEEIPEGYTYVQGGKVLNEALFRECGSSLYVDGDLILNSESEPFSEQLERLCVLGTLYLPKRQVEIIKKIASAYQNLEITKGKVIQNTAKALVDAKMLAAEKDGILIRNCASVQVKEDVSPEMISEKLELKNCAKIKCTSEQKAVLQMVSENYAVISDGTEKEKDEEKGENPLSVVKKIFESKLVNAENYQL